jgi:hypothetical protein
MVGGEQVGRVIVGHDTAEKCHPVPPKVRLIESAPILQGGPVKGKFQLRSQIFHKFLIPPGSYWPNAVVKVENGEPTPQLRSRSVEKTEEGDGVGAAGAGDTEDFPGKFSGGGERVFGEKNSFHRRRTKKIQREARISTGKNGMENVKKILFCKKPLRRKKKVWKIRP